MVIAAGTCLISDGHPSYPSVVENLGVDHKIVNHTLGFINDDGFHTNDIENLWSCMKSDMTRQHGMKRENIDEWLGDFIFTRKNIDIADPNSYSEAFLTIIKHL